MRHALCLALTTFLIGGLAALAGPGTDVTIPAAKKARPERPKDEATAEEREAIALAFVRENHPELALLLEPLKAMKPAQYQKAIAELYQVVRSLSNLKKVDPRRYEAALGVWKARSRVEVLAAQIARAPSPGLEGQLKAAVEDHFEAQLNQQRVERSLVRERLRKLDESIDRLESKRDALIESRFQGLIKKSQRARRPGEGPPAPAKSARTQGENKA